ncbi:methyl-accepting chemotaxis protein [Chitinimonas koreensis]|uniref:methyl-accepting chemotaxis protein n=1 Tax=Chitinimonas koreensis TaxID=356302 RepID=UPI0003F68842|nr:methyl-accepting chemotaxis protein [Chitinimonas koreensis]QNM97663.1 methyl-accepting chemotaxis protein [Chitinimonas koreensis]
MSLLASISVRTKLALVVAVPLAALLVAAGSIVWKNAAGAAAMGATVTLTRLLGHAGNLAHALQGERGNTAGFLAAGGADGTALAAARGKTDAARTTLQQFVAGAALPERVGEALAASEQALGGLAALRGEVDGRSIEPAKAFDRYSGWVGEASGLAQTVARETADAGLMRRGMSLVALLCVMEQSARERGLLNGVFTANQFAPAAQARLTAAVARQESCEQQFLALAEAAVIDAYRQRGQEPAFAETRRLRQLAQDKAADGQFGVDPKQWFATASQRLDGLLAVRDALLADIRSEAESELATARTVLWTSLTVALAVLAFTVFLAWRIAQAIAGPVAQVESLMSRLRDSLDLTLHAQVQGNDEIARIAGAFNALVDTFQRTVREVDQCADAVARASGSLADTTDQVSTATHSQAESVNGIAASVEQVTVSIATMAASSQESEVKAHDAQECSVRGREVAAAAADQMRRVDSAVSDAAGTIVQLSQRSSQIDGIVGTIRDIADQTNLLALNAAIEAARAGEQGRGFAVVADEVRKLAERAANATRDISQLVAAIRSDTDSAARAMRESSERMEQGVGLVGEVSAALGQIHGGTVGTLDAAREIAVAMGEQKVASETVAQAIERIAQMTEENSRAVQQAAELAHNLSQLSGLMAGIVGRFRLA